MRNNEKIYRKALDEINSNIYEWYQGEKYIDKNYHNDGEGFVSNIQCIVENVFIKINN